MQGSSSLFEPIEIAGRRIANRIVCAPHWTGFNEGAGFTDRYGDYLEARAEGGAGWVVTEPIASHPTARRELPPGTGPWETDMRDDWRRVGQRVQRHGARISLTIGHAGRNTTWMETGLPVLAPSPVPSPTMKEDPLPLTEALLDELVGGYARIAAMAVDAGFDGLELQSTADYLFGSFLSPLDNQREDAFAGSMRARAEPLRQALSAVRGEVGDDALLGIRMSAEHGVDGGLGAEAAAETVGYLSGLGLLDYVSVIVGSYHNLHLITPTMGSPVGPAVGPAATVRRAGIPVVVAGRIPYPEEAGAVLDAGQADLLAFARPFIADPAWPRKIRDGAGSLVRHCLYCNQQCVRRLSERRPISCVQNPAAGREVQLSAPSGSLSPSGGRRTSLRVTVIGAGPAGLEAAATLAAGGAEVTVVDAADDPGGRLRLATSVPGRQEWRHVTNPRVAEILSASGELHLGRRVHEAALAELASEGDSLVLATGGRPWRAARYRTASAAPVPGLVSERLLDLDRAVADPPRDERLLVVEEAGSRASVALLTWLRGRGCDLHVVTSSPQLAWPSLVLTQEWRPAVSDLLASGVSCDAMSRVVGFDGDVACVRHAASGIEHVVRGIERVLWLLGDEPTPLAFDGPVVAGAAVIGDARSARGAGAAISDGRRVAHALLAGGDVPTVYRAGG
ncbi:MAG: NAD(P)-binding protein [Propionibacteriales bacterium]|nr:NAD(P)-binding protein [Propionibacteriales bacterium]